MTPTLAASASTTSGGTAFGVIDRALRGIPEYERFRSGELARAQYCAWLRNGAPIPSELGLNEDQLNLSSRFPVDERASVARTLESLRADGLIGTADYPEDAFERWRKEVDARFGHGRWTTYIFPEEARLLFALGHLTAPRHAVFPGSYYGYWAVWAMPGILAAGGRATLIDTDPDTMALAEANFRALGMTTDVEYAVSCAIALGRTLDETDLCVIDAEGPRPEDAPEGLDPRLVDKAIYEPIMESVTPALKPGSLLIAHNMLLENLTDNPYFRRRMENNRAQYAGFHRHLDEHYDIQRVLPTSEGVGIYRRRPHTAAGAAHTTAGTPRASEGGNR